MTFRSSMDTFTGVVTHTIIIICMLISAFMLCLYVNDWNITYIAVIGAIAFCIFLIYAATIRKYIVSGETLTLKSILYSIKIKRSDIHETRLLSDDDIQLFSLMRMGGIFGYSGVYFSRQCGKVLVFGCKTRGEKVALQLYDGRIFILMPDKAVEFMQALQD